VTTLIFVEQRELFSIYRTPSGEPVYLANNDEAPFTRYTIDIDDIEEEWAGLMALPQRYDPHIARYLPPTEGMTREQFVEFLRATLTQPHLANDVRWCRDCDKIAVRDEGHHIGGEFVCDTCIDNSYRTCNDCASLVHRDDGFWTLGECYVCQRCFDNNYHYCEDCDGYYHRDWSDDHTHGDPGCCESPALGFTVRNDGQPALANDTKTTVTLPAGVIDEEGLNRIVRYLCDQGLYEESGMISHLSPTWQTREGNFTKRFSRTVYKKLGRKVTPEVLSMIGTIAAEHSKSVDFTIGVTRDLNQGPEYFYHDDSCWWQSHYKSRCALKTNGGFGLLTYNPYTSGRAWVMPLKKGAGDRLTPTFDTMTPDAFIVFNGYGDLEGYTAARIVSHMAGMTYRKVGFECEPMYINAGGYLVAPEDIAAKYTDGYLNLSVSTHSTLFDDEQRAIDLTETEKELITSVA
jgi:hypothetical protein